MYVAPATTWPRAQPRRSIHEARSRHTLYSLINSETPPPFRLPFRGPTGMHRPTSIQWQMQEKTKTLEYASCRFTHSYVPMLFLVKRPQYCQRASYAVMAIFSRFLDLHHYTTCPVGPFPPSPKHKFLRERGKLVAMYSTQVPTQNITAS